MSNPPKILIVDDTAGIRTALRVFLTQEGCDALEARDGAEGLNMARKHMPDLILLDIMMPGMDGLQTLERLKGAPETKDIPVLMLTSITQKDSVLAAKQLGARDYVLKPFKLEVLRERLRNVLGAERFSEAASPQAGRRVLVVDDEDAIRSVFSSALMDAGYHVVVAVDGRDAYAKARSANYDLVVCDLAMPDWDGLAVIRSLSLARIPTRIIVISAYVTREARESLAEISQVVGVYHKPVTPPQVVEHVRNALTSADDGEARP